MSQNLKPPFLAARFREGILEHPDGAALGFLLAATLALFLKYLCPQTSQVLSRLGDLSTQFVWWREFGFEELKKGHLALWNPHLFCGAPFFAGFQSALLYPLNWIFLFLPLAFALNLSMTLHVFLAGWFTYLWVRRRGSHPASALLAAFIYMFSGAFFVRIVVGHLSNLCSMTWIPLVFWAVEGWKGERRVRWIAWGALALAFQFFSGHIQYAYYTALAVGFYAAGMFLRLPGKFRFVGGIAAMYGTGVLLAAVQLLAGWDAVKESVRAGGMNMGVLDMLDLTPERICTLLMPYFYGGWRDYWGGGIYCEGNLFASITGFILALYAWKASKEADRKVFAAMALLVLWLMVGAHTPLFGFFCRYFPLFNRFRGVSKLNSVLVLCVALLAAMAHDAVLKDPGILRRLFKPLWVGSGLFLLAGVVFFLAPKMGGARLFRQFLPHASWMALNLALTGAFLLVLAFFCRAVVKKPGLKWGFLCLVLVECLFFAVANLSSFDLDALRQKISLIQQTYDKDPGDYRVWMDSANYTLGAPSGRDVWGEDPMMPLRYAEFAVKTQGYDFEKEVLTRSFFRRITPALGLLRLRYIFRDQGDHLSVERLKLPELPRAFFVTRVLDLPYEEILEKTVSLTFHPLQEALVEEKPGISLSGKKPRGEVRAEDLTSDSVEIHAATDQPALLVLTDNYSKDWKIRPLEGDRGYGPILPVNGFQMGIPLEKGNYHFVLEYRPTAFVVGKWISIVSWVIFLLGWVCMYLFQTRLGKGRRGAAQPPTVSL